MNVLLLLAVVLILLLVAGLWIGAKRLRQERERAARAEAATRQTQRQLDATLFSAQDAVVTVDAESRILNINPPGEKMFGQAAGELVKRPLADMVLPTAFGKSTGKEFIGYFLAENGTRLRKPQEMSAVRANGTPFPVELVAERIGGDGTSGLVIHLRETTERARAETALFERANLAALNSDISAALAKPDGQKEVLQRCAEALVWHLDVGMAQVWTMSEEGEGLLSQAEASTGIVPAAEDGWLSFTDSDLGQLAEGRRTFQTTTFSEPVLKPSRAEWARHQEVVAMCVYPLHTTGKLVGLLVLYDRKKLPDGWLPKVGAVADGISQFIERSRAEQHVRDQAALLDKATDAILVRDFSGGIRYWNKGAERIYGYAAGEALGRKADELLPADDVKAYDKAQQSALANGEWSGEFTVHAKDGKLLIMENRWTLVRAPDGSARSILVIATDITEKKELEQKFLRTQRLEIIGTLAGGIAHDLNNLLGPIVNSSQLLRTKLTDEKSMKWLAIMEGNAVRGAGMVKQILAFARGLDSERGPFQLRHIISDVERMAQETFPPGIIVESEMPRDLRAVFGNASQMHQVVLNLCVNARDAMPDGGHLKINADNVEFAEGDPARPPELKPGSFVRMCVADTGTGIPPELIEKIFEPFFTTKDPGKGTGLGLSTVANIIKQHEGVLRVSSEQGVGTVFEVFLPVAKADESGLNEKVSVEKLVGHGEKILLVDDEVAIREMTKAALENYGYTVSVASHGQDALKYYVQNRATVNLVVMDMMMPFMDGATTIQALRKIDPKVKIIAISGTVSQEDISMVEGLDRIIFLAKPFNTDKLLEALRTTLGAPN